MQANRRNTRSITCLLFAAATAVILTLGVAACGTVTSTALGPQRAASTPSSLAPGSIVGFAGYPGEGIPAIDIVAIRVDKQQPTLVIHSPGSRGLLDFKFDPAPAGTYHLLAYPVQNPADAGGYTRAVACGLLASCTDHTLVDVVVSPGQPAIGVQITDYYAPPGTFPPEPSDAQ